MPMHPSQPIKAAKAPKTPIGKPPKTMGQKKVLMHIGAKSKGKIGE